MLKFIEKYNTNNGEIFLWETKDTGYPIESTMMQDIRVNSDARTSMNPSVIWNNLVPVSEKLLLTVSTQKGCAVGGGEGKGCTFCDVSDMPFKGNLIEEEMLDQIDMMLTVSPYYQFIHGKLLTNKAKIGFARMGEPAHNLENVLSVMQKLPKLYEDIKWLPCFNSIFPEKVMGGLTGLEVLTEVIKFKEKVYDGFLHLQISANSTNEDDRAKLFRSNVIPLEDIINHVNRYRITNRTITLNFILMNGIEVNPAKLAKMGICGDKFSIKLIPMNNTCMSEQNNLTSVANYDNYDYFIKLKKEFESYDLKVITDSTSRIENLSAICCGQLARKAIKNETVFRNVC